MIGEAELRRLAAEPRRTLELSSHRRGFHPARLSDYALAHLTKHFIAGRRPERMLSVEGRRYFDLKLKQLGYEASILGDLKDIAASIAQESRHQDGLVNLLDIAAWKMRLSPKRSESVVLFAAEHALRARLGGIEQAAGQTDQLGTQDDRLLVHAELALLKARAGTDVAQHHLDLVKSLSPACDPAVRELVAARLAALSPETAIAMAAAIPRPPKSVDSNASELPNPLRALWRVFSVLAAHDELCAITHLASLSDYQERLFASLGIAHALIRLHPSEARKYLDLVFGCFSDPDQISACARLIITFIGREYADLPVAGLLGLLDDAMLSSGGGPGCLHDLFPVLDDCVRRDSQACVTALGVIEAMGLRDLLHWRLRVSGIRVSHERLLKDRLGAEFSKADEVVAAATRDTESAQELLSSITTTLVRAHTFVLMAQQGATAEPEYAQALLGSAFRFWEDDNDCLTFWSRLEILQNTVKWDEFVQNTSVVGLIEKAGEFAPFLGHIQAARGLGEALARSLDCWGDQEDSCLAWLVTQCRQVRWGETILDGVVRSLSEASCARLARQASAQSPQNSINDADSQEHVSAVWRRDSSFLSMLAERVMAKDRALGVSLFRMAAERVSKCHEQEVRDTSAMAVLTRVLRCEPRLAWEIKESMGCASTCLTYASRYVLQAVTGHRGSSRDSLLRLCLARQMIDPAKDQTLENLWSMLTIDARKLYGRTAASEPNWNRTARSGWIEDLIEAFKQYILGSKGNEWDQAQLYDAAVDLAELNWSAFMTLVNEPEISHAWMHLVETKLLTPLILNLNEPADQLLEDVLALQRAKVWKRTSEDSELEDLRGWILACGAVHDPRFVLEAIADAPESVVVGFTQSLCHLEPSTLWSDGQIAVLLDWLAQWSKDQSPFVAQGCFVEWLSRKQSIGPLCTAKLAATAQGCGESNALYEGAMRIRRCCPELAAETLAESLRQARKTNDPKTILLATAEVVRAGEGLAPHQDESEAFQLAPYQEYLKRDRSPDAQRICPEAWASILGELEWGDDEDAKRFWDASVQAVRLDNPSDLATVIETASRLNSGELPLRSRFLRSIIKRAIRAGLPCGPFLADAAIEPKLQIEVLTAIADLGAGQKRGVLLQEAVSRAELLEGSERAAALLEIGQNWILQDPQKAIECYVKALQAASECPNASSFYSCVLQITGDCVEHSILDGARVAQTIQTIIAQAPFDDEQNVIYADWKAWSLLAASMCHLCRGDPRSEDLLGQAAAEFRSRSGGHTSCAFLLRQAFDCAHRGEGIEKATMLVQSVFGAIKPNSRQGLCNTILDICVRDGSTYLPLSRYQVWQHAVGPGREFLIKLLIPLCSAATAAAAWLKLAVDHTSSNPEEAKLEVEKAVALFREVAMNDRSNDFEKTLWTVYAITHGIEGCTQSLQEVIPDSDNRRLNLPGIIAVACDVVADSGLFLRDLWRRLCSLAGK